MDLPKLPTQQPKSGKHDKSFLVMLHSSPYHKPVSAVNSKRGRSSSSGLSKMEELPEQENNYFCWQKSNADDEDGEQQ